MDSDKIRKSIISTILFFIFAFIASLFVGSLASDHELALSIDSVETLLTDSLSPIVLLGFAVMWLLKIASKIDKSESISSSGKKSRTKDGKNMDQYYSSRLLTEKELKKDGRFMYSLYSDLKRKSKDGILIRAEYKRRKLHVNMYKPIHTMIVGTTGSGKTTTYIDPMLQILPEIKTKPSLVISDPKGELFQNHAGKLRKKGYHVQVIDLREPQKSDRWNPLERAYDFYHRAHNLIDEVKVYKNVSPNKFKELRTFKSAKYGNEWYAFNNIAYSDKESLKHALKSKKSKLVSKAENEIEDISQTLCPISGNEPMWSMGAQGFIKGVLLAMLEDSLIPETGMTKEKFIFFNMSKIANKRDVHKKDNLHSLKQFFAGRDKLSPAAMGGNNVIQNADSTARGFLGHVNSSIKMFQDTGVNYLTSGTDVDLANIANKPTAIFIKVPDENTTRHPLANIYISQLYKILIEMANDRKSLALPRNVYFMLDEFGNLPKIESIKSFITAGRSRKIFLVIVVQSFTQLNSLYGDKDASTIKENCNIQIFIGTKDQKTKEEFSKSCGNVTLDIEDKSESKQSGGSSGSSGGQVSKSTKTVTRPLIYPEELDHLDRKKGEALINLFSEYSLKTILTPSYNCSLYDMTYTEDDLKPTGYLDTDKLFYDIEKRNEKILKDDDDDDFDIFS